MLLCAGLPWVGIFALPNASHGSWMALTYGLITRSGGDGLFRHQCQTILMTLQVYGRVPFMFDLSDRNQRAVEGDCITLGNLRLVDAR